MKPQPHTALHCTCGRFQLALVGRPIVSVACCCQSCRAAGARMQKLPSARPVLDAHGCTPFVLFRKDRVRFLAGAAALREFRLQPASKTRRVVASCCNTPVFLEFQSGHWLSLYRGLWPEDERPPLQMRTMAVDAPAGTVLPDDVPNARRQPASFMFKLLGAWIAMGLKSPKIAVNGALRL